ncbi:Double zinc ribbon [Symmachiella macrocystis]|uniref:Double zinc ribbon n=1 Tax=Symmachiella macrocystis TaxID=2527985 RepID=A0A5C6BQC7_9PLAN|nr:hypothetical protein [Symmachiella macrocystis]TWU13591.1 Double zinc ribbon [Symmachiella macrocystis]
MPNITCPQCRAEIDDDLWESTGRAECPFCGADMPELAAAAPAENRTNGAEDGRISLPPLPSKSVIQIIEVSPDRRVFYIPGGRAGAIGFFALVWNGFMAVFTTVMISTGVGDKPGDMHPLGIVAFIGLFWLIGLGFAYWWVKAKFQRLFVMLEPKRVVIQRVLFGRKRVAETELKKTSRAELIESYQQNNRPVYRIEIVGEDRSAKFGTSLKREEKNWLVDRINEFLHPAGTPPTGAAKFCSECGEGLQEAVPDPVTGAVTCPACGTMVSTANIDAEGELAEAQENAEIDTAEFAQPADLVIDEQRGDHLKFHLPICSHATLSWIVAGIAFLFGGIFLATSLSSLLNFEKFDVVKTLFLIPFLMGGLVPISVGLFALLGRITTDITAQRIKVRYHLGLIGKSKEMVTDQITEVKLMTGAPSNPRIQNKSGRSHSNNIAASVIKSANHMIPLTLIHNKPTARYVTQLVRRQLREMGVEFP